MKLVRFGDQGAERPGVIDTQGNLRDVSQFVDDWSGQTLDDQTLQRLAAHDLRSFPPVQGDPRLGCPIGNVGKFIAIGLNYTDHAEEAGLAIPTEPVLFTKAISCIQGPDDPVMLPRDATKGDWEVELGVVIGKRARYVTQAEALGHVAGYCVINDVSERAFQFERGMTWDKGKGCDTFGPVGPWLVTRDAVPDPQNLEMWLDLNGERMQTGSTSRMIFDIARIVSYVSEFVTLLPGDLLCTGTPPGVGFGMKPPVYLKEGDVMTLSVQGLGRQRQLVVPFRR